MSLVANMARVGLAAVLAVGLAAGCSRTTVDRPGAEEQPDLTTEWNDRDSQKVAETMIEEMQTFPWLARFQEKEGEGATPAILVQQIRNRSHTQIPVNTFINDIRRAGLRQGNLQFVAGGDARADIRQERQEQQEFATPESQAALGQELGADYVLSGEINSTVEESGRTRSVTYQVDLRLIDVTSTREVWNGQESVRKVERTRFLGIF